jgi:hypothetical protein
MRYVPGYVPKNANESITSHMLLNHVVSNPDILPGVTRLWRNDITPFSSMLADRKMFSQDLGFDRASGQGFSNKQYRVMSQNHVQYAIESSDRVVVRIVEGPSGDGKGYRCDAYPNEPGKNQSIVSLFVDTDWLSPKDVFEFSDNETLGYIFDERLPEITSNGAFTLNTKIVTNDRSAFIPLELLEPGMEIGFAMTAFEHDFSKTAYEKYTFDGWGHAYMTLQRMKYSYSGTAAAMAEGKRWIEHNGTMSFLTYAQDKMMKRFAQANEFANIFGKGTVTEKGEILLKDSNSREIMVGDGVLNQGDGAFQYPFYDFNRGFLEGIMSDLRIKTGKNGHMEVAAVFGQHTYNSFQRMMDDMGQKMRTEQVWETTSEGTGYKGTYSFYEFGGVRLIPKLLPWYSHPDRPKYVLEDGTIKSGWEGLFVALGDTTDGYNGVELITLKDRLKIGAVHGIDKGGDAMQNEIDGSHHHILFQSGIVNRNQEGIARIYRPVKKIRA